MYITKDESLDDIFRHKIDYLKVKDLLSILKKNSELFLDKAPELIR